ncbi:Flavanone 3-dioxygenase [Bertholletia excelsa]
MLVNHGIPESLMKELVEGCQQFFDLPEEAKKQYLGAAMKDVWAPIRCSSGVDSSLHKAVCWRDFLKAFVHPTFNFPTILPALREVAREYNKRTRAIAAELLKGISQHLGLEENYIQKSMEFDSGFQVFAANLYPPCPQPEQAMGIPAHTDHGLITLLIQNGVGGLQIKHDGEWFNVDPVPNSILVNTADHLEVLSNGKYKSIWHRAAVNSTTTRISIAVAHGPPIEKVVGPAPELVDGESRPPVFKPMLYKEYMELQQQGKHGLDATRLTQAA